MTPSDSCSSASLACFPSSLVVVVHDEQELACGRQGFEVSELVLVVPAFLVGLP
jgi:hypothetical protein